MRQIGQPVSARQGFTLAELLVVILLMVLLAGLIFSVSSGVFQKGDRSRAESELEGISMALEAYRQKFADYPDVDRPRQFYDALVGKLGPKGLLLAQPVPPFLEAGQYVLSDEDNSELLDPWGEPYRYLYIEPDPQTKISSYHLFSKGPDNLSTSSGYSSDAMDDDNIRYGD